MLSKTDYLIERMYTSAQYVHEKGPPYIYGGRDPIYGLDCSGLAMFLLGKMGYDGEHEDMNSAYIRTYVYDRSEPDPALGRRAHELNAQFIWENDATVVHVAMPAAPHLIVHAINTPRDILAWYGVDEAQDRAEEMLDRLDNIFWDDTGEPILQKILYKLTKDSISFATEYWVTELAPDIVNWLTALDDYDSYTAGHPTPDEAHVLMEKIRARKLGRDGFVPDSISLSADHYEYDVSELHDSMGRAGIKEEVVCKLLGLNRDSAAAGSCVSMTSDSKFRAFYNARSTLSVEKRYMSYDSMKQFIVSNPNVNQFGPGSSDLE